MTYRQITFVERHTLGLLRQGGLTPAVIARVLRRHRSPIGREARRNGTPREGCTGRSSRSGMPAGGASLREEWSPEQVAGWLRHHRLLAISRRPRKRLGYRTPEDCYAP